MDQNLYDSKKKLIQVVNSYLKKLNKSSTLEELQKANEFLKETKSMAETIEFISSMGEETDQFEDCDTEQTYADSGLNSLVDFIVEGCGIIIALNSIKDHEQIKKGKLQWITEDTYRYLEEARIVFGSRVPIPPNLIGVIQD